MNYTMILVGLTALAAVLLLAGDAAADTEPEWSYTTGDNMRAVSISANGEYIAVGSWDDTINLFDKDSNTPIWSYTTGDNVRGITISADGEYIVAGSKDKKIYLFGKDSNTPLWSYTTGDGAYPVAISADGEYIAAGSYDGNIYFFNKDSSTPLWSYDTGGTVYMTDISADGEYIAVGSGNPNPKVYLFDKDSNTPLWTCNTGGAVRWVAISEDGEYIAAGSNDDYKVRLFEKSSGTPLWSYTTGSYIYSVSISADGEYIAVGSDDDKAYLFDKDSNTPLWSYDTGDNVKAVAISADGKYLAVGSNNNRVYLFETGSSTPLWDYTTEDNVWRTDISADGGYFIAGSDDNKAYLFSTNGPPTAIIGSITPSSGKEGTTITFQGHGEDRFDEIVAYNWSSSIDELISTDANFNTSSLSLGHHIISFKVQDENGDWSDSATDSVWIYAYPIAITGDDISTIPNTPVQFVGAGTDEDGAIVKYEWDFDGDGIFEWSSEDSGFTTFTYNIEGDYTAILRVTDDDGFTSNTSREVIVELPTAIIDSISPSSGIKSTTVMFQGHGEDRFDEIVAYNWSSSIDELISTEANFSTSSLSLGHHIITFKVQDDNGDWSDTVTDSVWIFAHPVAIAGDDVSTIPGAPVQFSGVGTDEDGSIIKYEWDFDGDGIFEWGPEDNGFTTFIYNTEGEYTAILRITDEDGFTSNDSRVITVKMPDTEGELPGFNLAFGIVAFVGVVASFRYRRRGPS